MNDGMLVVVAVYDVKSERFQAPIAVSTVQQAVRSFTTEVNRADEANMLYKFPDDFELWELGHFDPISGGMVSAASKVVAGASVKKG